MPRGCLSLVLLVGIVILFPLFLANAVVAALAKLGLSPQLSIIVAVSIFVGGLFNIPLRRIPRVETIDEFPVSLFGFRAVFPGLMRRRTHTIIAVNVGGCIVPCLLVVYELFRLGGVGPGALALALVAAAVNIAVCYRIARPLPNIGIALPAFVPALAAAACGLLFMHEQAPAIAFTAGVLGPLVGADLLHLRDIERIGTGMASIGGAGTFDGIVLSGLIATLLA